MKKGPIKGPRLIGAGTRNRTTDLLITNQLLYQLSYAGFLTVLQRAALFAFAMQSARAKITIIGV